MRAMSSAPVAGLIVVLTLAAVLLTSGVAKLRDPRATRDAFVALRVPRRVPVDAAATALPWTEIALAVLLVAAPAGWLVPVSVALVLLMLAYTWLVARALGFDGPVSCSCFGSLGRHEIDRTTLLRNVLLVALAGVLTWFAADGGSAPAAFGDLDGGGWWALAATAAAAAVAVLVTGVAPTSSLPPADGELLDYERQAIPYGVLTGIDGKSWTLTELAERQARLLVVLNPYCGSCVRTAEKIDAWAHRMAPAVGILVVYPHRDVDVAHSEDLVWVEPELNVRRLFSVGAPSAVLLGADGLVAGGPVTGEDGVEHFVQDILAELETGQPRGDVVDS